MVEGGFYLGALIGRICFLHRMLALEVPFYMSDLTFVICVEQPPTTPKTLNKITTQELAKRLKF